MRIILINYEIRRIDISSRVSGEFNGIFIEKSAMQNCGNITGNFIKNEV